MDHLLGSAAAVYRQQNRTAQAGLSLIEVSVVMAIILLIAIVSIPTINNYVIESRVPKVGESVARFIANHNANTPLFEQQPYAGIDNELFALQMESAGVFNISTTGGGTVILHGLGKNGTLDISGGDELVILFSGVHHSACPGLSSVLQRLAHTIQVGEQTVKADNQTYNAITAQKKCAKGDVNTFKFTIS